MRGKIAEGIDPGARGVPPRTHDLVILQKTLSEIEERSQHLEGICITLTDYAVAPRYPGWEDLVGNVDIDCVLGSARAVLEHALLWLKLAGTSGK